MKPAPRGALNPKECLTILAGEIRAASDFLGEGFRSPNFTCFSRFETYIAKLIPAPPVVKRLILPNSVNKRQRCRFIGPGLLTVALSLLTGLIEQVGLDESTIQCFGSERLRRTRSGLGRGWGVSDKATVLSVYPGAIGPAKTTRMKRIDFPHWPERLAQAP